MLCSVFSLTLSFNLWGCHVNHVETSWYCTCTSPSMCLMFRMGPVFCQFLEAGLPNIEVMIYIGRKCSTVLGYVSNEEKVQNIYSVHWNDSNMYMRFLCLSLHAYQSGFKFSVNCITVGIYRSLLWIHYNFYSKHELVVVNCWYKLLWQTCTFAGDVLS